jgi:hypothetical protein
MKFKLILRIIAILCFMGSALKSLYLKGLFRVKITMRNKYLDKPHLWAGFLLTLLEQ